ncbi:MAG: prepilin peptidase [Sedimentisphaerales bacterium]|nr:prepilin peptidase [Sedimentisphaerales bacterium]
MIVPDWIWFCGIFTLGCCIGSFLNVVIYRMPREQSIISPPSVCPSCGQHIRFYDNIPLVSWLVLRAKCRYCKNAISPRYFVIELLTGLVFLGLFVLYFRLNLRAGLESFLGGGWFIYLIHIVLLAAFIAASAIDLELKVIPISICWLATLTGIIASALGPYVIDPVVIDGYNLLPTASSKTGSLAAGAVIGLGISLVLLSTGLIKRSYDDTEIAQDISKINHRTEICREILFLLPIIGLSVAAYLLLNRTALRCWWVDFSQHPAISGILGSLWGYFVGCAVVWITRILGTLGFGKEAMGLGDVHLMGAAGAVIGWPLVIVTFFIAPFFGLAWACLQMFFKKTQQIPYGPFLSLGVFVGMILHDRIFSYLILTLYH